VAACGSVWLCQEVPTHARWWCARCKCWNCSNCGPWRRKRLLRQIEAGRPDKLATITVPENEPGSPTEHAYKLTWAFKQLKKRIRRRWKSEPFEYYAVMEATKRGQPHLHLCLRAPFIPQWWLSQQMRELINAPIVDIRKIHCPRRAARYVSKYVAKDPTTFGNLKRAWHSKNWIVEKPPEPECDWSGAETRAIKHCQPGLILQGLVSDRWLDIKIGDGCIIARKPFPEAVLPLWYTLCDLSDIPQPRRPAYDEPVLESPAGYDAQAA